METNDRVAQLESEIKILKNEVQAVLLDLRDKYLEAENPFNTPAPSAAPQPIIIDRPAPAPQPAPATARSVVPEGAVEDEPELDPAPNHPREDAPITRQVRKGARQPETLPPQAPPRDTAPCRDMGLVTAAGLACWVDDSVRRLGRQRTETVLDLAEMMGFLAADLKQVLGKLVRIEPDEHVGRVATRDYFDSLMKITTLLGKDNQTEETMLTILFGEDLNR